MVAVTGDDIAVNGGDWGVTEITVEMYAAGVLMFVPSVRWPGFEQTSGNRELLYRVEEFPGVGFLAKRATLDKLVATLPHCCRQRLASLLWCRHQCQPARFSVLLSCQQCRLA